MSDLFAIKLQELFKHSLDSIELVMDGVNKNFKVSRAGESFFIRLSPTSLHQYSDIVTEVNVLKTANAAQVPCCQVIPVNGDDIIGPIVMPDQEYYGLCNSLVAGRPLLANVDDVRLFAKALGLLHHAEITNTENLSSPVNVFSTVVSIKGNQKYKEMLRIAHELDNQFGANKQRLYAAKLSAEFGLCHGDAWLGNGLFEQGSVSLFDFEHSHFGSTAFDIATFVWSLFDFDDEIKQKLYLAFVDGYRSVCNKRYDADYLCANIVFNEVRRLLFFIKFIQCDESIADELLTSAQRLFDLETDQFVNDVKKSKLFFE